MLENIDQGGTIRSAGKLRKVPAAYQVREIPFTGGQTKLAVTIPGVTYPPPHSTRIPNIQVYTAIGEKH